MLKRLTLVTLVAVLVAVVAASSIQGAAKFGGTFTMAVSSSPPMLDMHTTTAGATQLYGGMYIWEGLAALDEKNWPQPMLAERWEFDKAKLEWTFFLRKGVKFHNGKEMTSEDVVASIKRWRQVSPRADAMVRVKDIVAADKYTVKFLLNEILVTLPFVLAQDASQPVIHPKEIIENAPPNKLSSYVGTGPYKLTEWIPDRQVVLERFKDYSARDDIRGGRAGKKVAYLDKIVFKSIPESEVRLAGLQTGEFDAATPLPQEYYAQLQKMKNVRPVIVKYDLKPVLYFSFAETSMVKNVTMRKAIRAALNMDDIMFAATGNKDSYELNPDQLWYRFQALWSDTGKEFYDTRDPALAKKLAKEAGYKGEPIRFLASVTQFHHRRPAIQITEQLRDAGFNVFLDLRDWPTVSEAQKDPKKFDLSYARTRCDYPSDVEQLRLVGGFDSPELQKMLNFLSQETALEKIRSAMETFKKEVMIEQIPWITMGDMFALRGERTRVCGLQAIYAHPLWNVWFEE